MASKSGSHSYSSKKLPPKPPNFVHNDSIHRETIRKELDVFQLRTDFFINPHQPGGHVTGKPNSLQEAEIYCSAGDEVMSETLVRALRVPTAKYPSSVTSSHEYGWYSQPLTDVDRSDSRFNYPKNTTDVTRYKQLEWRAGLGTRSSTGVHSRRPRGGTDGAASSVDDRQR